MSICESVRDFIDTFYWTPGWGNIATVTVTGAGIWVAARLNRRHFEFDKEQDRRTIQRQPIADVIESFLAAGNTFDRFITQAIRADEKALAVGIDDDRYKVELRKLYDQGENIGNAHTELSKKIRLSQLTIMDDECQAAIVGTSILYDDLSATLQNYMRTVHLNRPPRESDGFEQSEVDEWATKRGAIDELNKRMKLSVSNLNIVASQNLKPIVRKPSLRKRTKAAAVALFT